jgi:nucleotide-binding universal stress UspA family protein
VKEFNMTWLPKQTIVVPVDFSGQSEAAIRAALELADDPSHVSLVHVLAPLDTVSPGVVWGEIDDVKREQAIRKYSEKALNDCGLAEMQLEVRVGDPGLEVAAYADEISADLIVIPAHGYHGVKRLLLGSVAERVLRHAHCPVLVLRRTDAD